MPTKNRRVATYLPKEIDASFEAFKASRGLEGDSQALIIVLSEFLGVSQQVAHQINLVEYATKYELEALSEEVAHLSGQIRSIDGFIEQAVERVLSELQSKQPQENSEAVPGQLELLEAGGAVHQEDTLSDEGWISSKEAWELLQPPNCSYDAFRKYSAEKLSRLYGLQADPSRKQEGKGKAKWLKMPDIEHPRSELLSELNSELPAF